MDPIRTNKTKKALSEILAEERRRYSGPHPQVSPPLPTYLMGTIKTPSGTSNSGPSNTKSPIPTTGPVIPLTNYYSALVSTPKTPEKKTKMLIASYAYHLVSSCQGMEWSKDNCGTV